MVVGRAAAMDKPAETSTEVVRRSPLQIDQPFFRAEVLAERRTQWLGTVLLAPRISQSLFAAFAALSVAAILGLLFFAEFTRKERINGWLVPEQGLVRVVAPQQGVIIRLHVKDGDRVSEGTPLVTLSTEVQSATFGDTQTEIVRRLNSRRESLNAERQLNRQLLQEEIAGLDNRIAALRSEFDQLDIEKQIQRSQAKLARATVERLRPVLKKGFITAYRMESAEENLLAQTLKLRTLEREQTGIDRERLTLEAQREALPIKTAALLGELDRNIAHLEQQLAEAEARRQIVISAAQAGTVTAMRAEQGSSANTTTPLLSIVPAGSELRAQLFVPSRAIGFIRPGQEVQLRYRAFPYQKFGHYQGVVRGISRSTVSPNELGAQLAGLTTLLSGDEPVYLVTVGIASQTITAYGDPVSLQPGMQLDADILVDTRRLIEWVFDPLFTLTGKWQS